MHNKTIITRELKAVNIWIKLLYMCALRMVYTKMISVELEIEVITNAMSMGIIISYRNAFYKAIPFPHSQQFSAKRLHSTISGENWPVRRAFEPVVEH